MDPNTPVISITVQAQNEVAAITYLKERGFAPAKIDKRQDGTVVLIYSPPQDRITELSQSLPFHLDPKMDVVLANCSIL